MNIGRAPKRIVLYVLLPAIGLYLGLRLWAQFRHVDVYVRREAPMPEELRANLHMGGHKIHPVVTIDSPYDSATNKVLALEEILRIRSTIARSRDILPFIDALIIESPTNVSARRSNRKFLTEYNLIKRGDQWTVENSTRTPLQY
jgi:hypothetical protein